MKWILAALVALNLGYFGWKMTSAREAPRPDAAQALPDPELSSRLVLLSEADPKQLRERTSPPRPPDPGGAPDPETVALAAPPLEGGAGQPPRPPRSTPLPTAAGTMTTIVPPPGLAVTYGLFEVETGATLAPDDARICYSVGPLSTSEEIEQARVWLDGQGAESTLWEDERRELALYWIYFPPMATRDEASKRMARMQGEGIDDIYIIPGGDMENAISLGVYSRRASLERRLHELRTKNYEPSIAPRYKTKRASWFDAVFEAGFDFQASGFADEFPTAEMSPVSCGVAERPAHTPPAQEVAPTGPDPEAEKEKQAKAAPVLEPAPAAEKTKTESESEPEAKAEGVTKTAGEPSQVGIIWGSVKPALELEFQPMSKSKTRTTPGSAPATDPNELQQIIPTVRPVTASAEKIERAGSESPAPIAAGRATSYDSDSLGRTFHYSGPPKGADPSPLPAPGSAAKKVREGP